MPTPRPSHLALALLASLAPACDDLTAGQLQDPEGPPILARILIQDEQPAGGRNAATDLLHRSAKLHCSEREPCPTGDQYSHPPCDLSTMLCPDPLDPAEDPAAIGIPIIYAGDQFRLVFNKRLDPALDVQILDPITGMVSGYTLADLTILGLYDHTGHEFKAVKYWDPTGSPTLTSDLFVNPFGPALVLKPKEPMLPLTSYEIRLKPDQMRDAQGQATQIDINGDPVQATYPFTTEGLRPAGGPLADFFGVIDTVDALVIKTSVRFDPGSLKVTVLKDGQPVEFQAAPEFGTDAKHCSSAASNARAINVFRVKGVDRALWEEGDYTVSVDAVAVDNPTAVFSADGFNQTRYHDVPFKVKALTDKDQLYLAEKRLLPWECAAGGPADMAGFPVPDFAEPADLAVPVDLASPPDLSLPDSAAPDAGPPADGGADAAKPPDLAHPADAARPLDGSSDAGKPVDGGKGG